MKSTLSKNGQRLYSAARKRFVRNPFTVLVSEAGHRLPYKTDKGYQYKSVRNGGDIINFLCEDAKVKFPLDGRAYLAMKFDIHVNYMDNLSQGWDYGDKPKIQVEAVLKHLKDDAKDGFLDGYIMYQRMKEKTIITNAKPKNQLKTIPQLLFKVD